MKHCRICKQSKPIDQFHRRTRSRDGLSDRCKSCSRDLGLQWRANNPSYSLANRERARQWAKDNPERAKARLEQWVKDNPDRVREGAKKRARRSYSKNPAKSLAASRKWRAANPDILRHFVRLRRARKKNAVGSHTKGEWAMMCRWFGNCCLCCGATEIAADHVIPISRGGSDCIANLQPLCRSCNSRKYTQTIDYRDPTLLAMLLEGMPDGL